MNNTEKRLEKHTKEVIIEQIDICLSGQDPRYQLGRYIEHLKEEIIHQALAEEKERVVEAMMMKGIDTPLRTMVNTYLRNRAEEIGIDLSCLQDKHRIDCTCELCKEYSDNIKASMPTL